MGEVSETSTTMTTKRKKKGRPSLLDLQKRSIKQQQHNQRFRQNPNLPNVVPHDDDDERKEKKHKLLVGLNSHHNHHSTLFPNSSSFDSDPDSAIKRRKIDPLLHGSHETDGKVPKATDSKHGSQGESGPTTPLPDKKLLLFILERLQKKDTHGVYSEPVDPEELPDYHDIVKHPMDFGTVRKKLDEGIYMNFEQFENDVFLICSNAMQYNSPDTIYYRQARAMQEIAKKDFENLRQDSDDDSDPPPPPQPQPKIVQRGRPPGKHTKKSLGMSPSERVAPESSSDATLASVGDIASCSNGYNLRKAVSKFQPTDLFGRVSHNNANGGGHTSWLSDWESEFPASVVKAVLRYGKKQFVVDETRRDTYKNPVASGSEPPVLAAIEDEFKQLIAVGLHAKHGYARSLARFAADLGPVVWKIAARKISSVLPIGQEFGPGWIGDDDVSRPQNFPVRDEERSSDPPVSEDHRSRFSSPSPSGSFPLANRSPLQSGDMIGSGVESMISIRNQQESMVHSDDFGSNNRDRLGSNFSPQMKMVRLADLTGSSSAGNVPQMFDMDPLTNRVAPTNVNPPLKAKFLNNSSQLNYSNLSARESGFEPQSLLQGFAGKSSWQEVEVPAKQNSFSHGDDLNGKIRTANSPNANVESGSQLQPNLALQL